MQDYIIRFVHVHQEFRLPELLSLAEYFDIPIEIVSYTNSSPYCLVRFRSDAEAKQVISRSVLIFSVYQLWGRGATYEELHQDVRLRSEFRWKEFEQASFWFVVRSFLGKRSPSAQRDIIESFAYLPFKGPIKASGADYEFDVLERFDEPIGSVRSDNLQEIIFGLNIGSGSRDLVAKYDLKKRRYISTTSMDAELALITANVALAGPGKLVYDPFLGTAGFPIACAAFGAVGFGSDIDGRSFQGQRCGRTRPGQTRSSAAVPDIQSNFEQYDTVNKWLDAFTADLINTPVRLNRILDAVVCDPPYGVREGIKVLGSKKGPVEEVFINGKSAYMQPNYIPPKKAYSFSAMLDDILSFSAQTLVDGGRLAFWIPTANDEEDSTFPPPSHPALEFVSESIQPFNKWSRRLVVYRRLPDEQVSPEAMEKYNREREDGTVRDGTADELNNFRKKYFRSFRPESPSADGNDPSPAAPTDNSPPLV